MDYLCGILLIISPWLFNFSEVNEARWVAIIVGALMLLMSFMTDYEGGVIKSISMAAHLRMDVLVGIFLALSPWIFGFSDQVYLPHLILGLAEICAGLFTFRGSEHPTMHHWGERMRPAH